jgi:hypothetical protein
MNISKLFWCNHYLYQVKWICLINFGLFVLSDLVKMKWTKEQKSSLLKFSTDPKFLNWKIELNNLKFNDSIQN